MTALLKKKINVLEFVKYKVGEGYKLNDEFNNKDYSIKMDKTFHSL